MNQYSNKEILELRRNDLLTCEKRIKDPLINEWVKEICRKRIPELEKEIKSLVDKILLWNI